MTVSNVDARSGDGSVGASRLSSIRVAAAAVIVANSIVFGWIGGFSTTWQVTAAFYLAGLLALRPLVRVLHVAMEWLFPSWPERVEVERDPHEVPRGRELLVRCMTTYSAASVVLFGGMFGLLGVRLLVRIATGQFPDW